jgi:hypothetical protein
MLQMHCPRHAKALLFSLCLLAMLAQATFAPPAFARGSRGGHSGDVSVHGYYRRDGTYVQPHMRSAPDGNFGNNWSTKGNINPYTGKPGTKVTPPPGYGGSYGGVTGTGQSGNRVAPTPPLRLTDISEEEKRRPRYTGVGAVGVLVGEFDEDLSPLVSRSDVEGWIRSVLANAGVKVMDASGSPDQVYCTVSLLPRRTVGGQNLGYVYVCRVSLLRSLKTDSGVSMPGVDVDHESTLGRLPVDADVRENLREDVVTAVGRIAHRCRAANPVNQLQTAP